MDGQQVKLTSLPWRWVISDLSRLETWFGQARELGLDGMTLLDGWLNSQGTVMFHLPRSIQDLREKCLCSENIRQVKSMLQAEGLQARLLTIHNDFYCYCRSEQVAERDRMKVVLDLSAEFDCDNIQIITGPVANEKGGADELVPIVADMINMVLDDLGGRRQTIAVENTPGVFRDPDTFMRLIEVIDHPQFRVNFDVKHVTGSSIEAARRVVATGKLFSAHIDNYLGENYRGRFPDNWDRNVALEKGTLDIPELVSVLSKGHPQWISNEFAGLDIDLVGQNIRYLRKLLRASNKTSISDGG